MQDDLLLRSKEEGNNGYLLKTKHGELDWFW